MAFAVAAVAAAALASIPGAAAGVPRGFAGVDFAFRSSVSSGDAAQMDGAGVRSVVFSIDWPLVEAQPGTYDWTASDTTIGDLAAAGIEADPILYGTPRWALKGSRARDTNANRVPPTATAQARAGWVAFVHAAVARYGANGSYWNGPYASQHPGATPMPVHVWQVWNEANLATYYWPTPRPKSYAQLLRISHGAIKGADPKAIVATGGLVCKAQYSCDRYLHDLYRQHGVKSDFDLVGLHPYGPDVHFVVNGVRSARKVMKRAHDARTKVWVSEIGWGSAPSDHQLNKGPKGQAKLLRSAFSTLARNRSRLRIWRVDWFDWRDPAQSEGNCSWCFTAGLLNSGGHPKPALKAFQQVN